MDEIVFTDLLALVIAALFTGAAVYINWAEHPARMSLDDRALLQQWKLSYKRGYAMQATLAVAGFVLGVLSWLLTEQVLWLAGALVLVANWPFTLFSIMPVNKVLMDTPLEQAGTASRTLLEKWGRLHAVRSVLGALSIVIFLLAMI